MLEIINKFKTLTGQTSNLGNHMDMGIYLNKIKENDGVPMSKKKHDI